MKKLKRGRTLEEELYYLGLIFLVLGCIELFLYFKVLLPQIPTFPCVMYKLWGIYCPGCGGTRAVLALFHGRILESLWYHPFVLYGVVIYGGFMLSHTLERLRVPRIKGWKFHNWYLIMAVVILVLNFLIKNILLRCFHITLDCIW